MNYSKKLEFNQHFTQKTVILKSGCGTFCVINSEKLN